jgi:prepilin-type N-terminal cleavage/methylation domain-containing protein
MKDSAMHTPKLVFKNQTGFTLIELLMVVAIIATLVTIAMPMFQHYKIRSYNAAALSDLKNFKVQLEAEFNDHQSYPIF